jgi:antitoxin component YwqK of YwqJK toxin-antitoxin module
MRKLLVIIFSLISLTSITAQKKEGKYHSREVIIQVEDTLIRANILTGELTEKPDPDKEYFWYSKGMINSNIGGYGGKLFHGDYLAFLNNKLIESGQFICGQKIGIWRSWYSSGKIKKISNWKDGNLDGRYCYYSENGIVERRGFYKNGSFHSSLKKSETNVANKIHLFKKFRTKKKPGKEGSAKNTREEFSD